MKLGACFLEQLRFLVGGVEATRPAGEVHTRPFDTHSRGRSAKRRDGLWGAVRREAAITAGEMQRGKRNTRSRKLTRFKTVKQIPDVIELPQKTNNDLNDAIVFRSTEPSRMYTRSE